MSWLHFTLAAVPFALAAVTARSAHAEEAPRISGPFVHENLAVYFVHGPSAAGATPLTLAEALEAKRVNVIETGAVAELQIENTGDEDIFIQSGDIVKGGRQDRVLTTSLLLPAKSGKVPIASFCVERGRWSARGAESMALFSLSGEVMPSRMAKLSMHAPEASAEGERARYLRGGRQGAVWDSVSKLQSSLSEKLNADVASPESETSLQLSLESEKLKDARANYMRALEKSADGDDVVGYAFAVNGRLNSADVYPSNGLFRKMWAKLLAASVTEAISEQGGEAAPVPDVAAVAAFLAGAEKGKAQAQAVGGLMDVETHDADAALYVEARSRAGAWVHRNYIAK